MSSNDVCGVVRGYGHGESVWRAFCGSLGPPSEICTHEPLFQGLPGLEREAPLVPWWPTHLRQKEMTQEIAFPGPSFLHP